MTIARVIAGEEDDVRLVALGEALQNLVRGMRGACKTNRTAQMVAGQPYSCGRAANLQARGMWLDAMPRAVGCRCCGCGDLGNCQPGSSKLTHVNDQGPDQSIRRLRHSPAG